MRSLIEVLPFLDVVEGDPFNSSPEDPKQMGPDALEQFSKGEKLPATKVRTPLVELPLGATEDRICGAPLHVLSTPALVSDYLFLLGFSRLKATAAEQQLPSSIIPHGREIHSCVTGRWGYHSVMPAGM